MFFKIGVLKNFVIFTGKYLCWGLFLIKLTPKRLQRRCFALNIVKCLRTPSLWFAVLKNLQISGDNVLDESIMAYKLINRCWAGMWLKMEILKYNVAFTNFLNDFSTNFEFLTKNFYCQAKKKLVLFLEMQVIRKIFTWAATYLFYLVDLPEIFSFLLLFLLSFFVFFF